MKVRESELHLISFEYEINPRYHLPVALSGCYSCPYDNTRQMWHILTGRCDTHIHTEREQALACVHMKKGWL